MIALGNDTMRALSKSRGHATHTAADGHVNPGDAGAIGERWSPPIVKCVATRGEGTGELVEALDGHRAWVEGTAAGRARRETRMGEEVREALREALIDAAVHDLGARLDEAVQAVDARSVDPYTATERLVAAFRSRS
jgi:LAO/AO transport system kinase